MKSAFSVYQWVNEQNTVTNSMSQWAEHWDHEHYTGTLTMHCHSASTYEQVSISHWHHNRCAHHNGTVPVASTVTSTALMTRDSGMWLIEFVTLKHSAYDKRLWDVTSTVTLSCETLGQWRETMKTCHELNESSSYFNVTNSMRHWDNEERLWRRAQWQETGFIVSEDVCSDKSLVTAHVFIVQRHELNESSS